MPAGALSPEAPLLGVQKLPSPSGCAWWSLCRVGFSPASLSSCELSQRAFRSPVLSSVRWGAHRSGEEERSPCACECILRRPAVINPERTPQILPSIPQPIFPLPPGHRSDHLALHLALTALPALAPHPGLLGPVLLPSQAISHALPSAWNDLARSGFTFSPRLSPLHPRFLILPGDAHLLSSGRLQRVVCAGAR